MRVPTFLKTLTRELAKAMLQGLNAVHGRHRSLANPDKGARVGVELAPKATRHTPDDRPGVEQAVSLRSSTVPPTPPVLSGMHAVCSLHAHHLSWRIQDYCQECDQVAMARVRAAL